VKIGIVGFGFVGQGMYRLFGETHDMRYWDSNGSFNTGIDDPKHAINSCDVTFI
jgi:homoserine dehydrogenase